MIFHAHGSEVAFYEIAATLIPFFLLAGAVVERVRPKPAESRHRVANFALFVPMVGAVAILAEVAAIGAVVSGSTGTVMRLLVASFVAAGMIATVISVWAPWLSKYREQRGRHDPVGVGGAAVILVLSFVGTVWILNDAVTTQHSEEGTIVFAEEVTRNFDATKAVENRIASIGIELARAKQEVSAAAARQECVVLNSFFEEQEAFGRILNAERLEERRLILEGSNLYREQRGESPKNLLPKNSFPPLTNPRLPRISERLCRRAERAGEQ